MIVISSGFHKTHVTTAAREASKRGLLSLAITAAYPTERLERITHLLRIADKGRVARLRERGEAIPNAQLRTLFLPELLDESARALARLPLSGRLYSRLSAATWRLYGRLAGHALVDAPGAQIYHFRAGFGQTSIEQARRLGMVILCDHAIAHPSVLGELVENRGRPRQTVGKQDLPRTSGRHHDPLERAILADIDRADAVVVNSNFVKETFLAVGWPADRVHVVYLGVDDNFLREIPAIPRDVIKGRLRLLFAGRLERRKGAEVLIEALRGLPGIDWELLVAGPVTPEIRSAHGSFLSDERVTLLGTLRRPELMQQMLAAPVFVFPSFAEGSARAAFEALACGCYVITTPNSGTIVEDGINGALVPPGDVDALAAAIVAAERDRQKLAAVGRHNSKLIADNFRQVHYGQALADLYEKLLGTESST